MSADEISAICNAKNEVDSGKFSFEKKKKPLTKEDIIARYNGNNKS
jgi:hypothetical protein